MRMDQLKLAPASVDVTGIEPGDYFAVDVLGMATMHCCRTIVHGVVFDESEEPSPYRPYECFVVLPENGNLPKLQQQCEMEYCKMHNKPYNKPTVPSKTELLVDKYAKKKR
jgi:hypothetical protein